MKAAFFDIGTNSIHMKVVEFHADGFFEILEHFKDMTRIGEGSFSSHRLSKASMKRAFKVLGKFASTARQMGAKSFVAIATSAVRDAENSGTFLSTLFKRTGIRARVISGSEEGRLIFLGACSGVELGTSKILSLDIGGGSAEFVLADRRHLDFSESYPLGVARLRHRFISKDPPSKADLRGLERHIEEMLSPAMTALSRKKYSRMIGTGGTLINLASMVYEAKEGRGLRLRGYFELRRKALQSLYGRIRDLSIGRLKKIDGVEKKRADFMTTGCLLVLTILKGLGMDRIYVSDKGIREGMILDYVMRRKMKLRMIPPCVQAQWFGQKPYFSGRILKRKAA